MTEYYDYEWYCFEHDEEFARSTWGTPKRCPKGDAEVEDGIEGGGHCDIIEIGEAGENSRKNAHDADLEDRDVFWRGRDGQ